MAEEDDAGVNTTLTREQARALWDKQPVAVGRRPYKNVVRARPRANRGVMDPCGTTRHSTLHQADPHPFPRWGGWGGGRTTKCGM